MPVVFVEKLDQCRIGIAQSIAIYDVLLYHVNVFDDWAQIESVILQLKTIALALLNIR